MEKYCEQCCLAKDINEFSKGQPKGKGPNKICYSCRLQNNREYYKNYYQQNKEKKKAESKRYREENKESLRKKKNEYDKKKMKEDPQWRLRVLFRKRYRHVFFSQEVSKNNSVLNYLGCTIDEAKIHLEALFEEGMNWENHGEWHIDHIQPCSSFDMTLEDERHKCFHYSNLQPLWAHENLAKGNRVKECLTSQSARL